jgi:predicted nucleic acid-binding protein
MRLALDTNRYTDLCRGDRTVVETVELADEVWLPFIALGELRAGFAVGSQGSRNEAVLRRFLLKPGVGVLYADEQTTHHYAAVYLTAAQARHPDPHQRYVDLGPRAATLADSVRPRCSFRCTPPTHAGVEFPPAKPTS